MVNVTAVKVALELMHVPSRARLIKSSPLPPDVHILLSIAAGDTGAENEAAALAERPKAMVREAAAFFIEQVLLSPESDSYRVLGVTSQASTSELRRNMALLLRWLHPDKGGPGNRSVLAGRVTQAWNNLKTVERRAGYDRAAPRGQRPGAKPGNSAAAAHLAGKQGSRSAGVRPTLPGGAGNPGLLVRHYHHNRPNALSRVLSFFWRRLDH